MNEGKLGPCDCWHHHKRGAHETHRITHLPSPHDRTHREATLYVAASLFHPVYSERFPKQTKPTRQINKN